jgi:hypothetical protein
MTHLSAAIQWHAHVDTFVLELADYYGISPDADDCPADLLRAQRDLSLARADVLRLQGVQEYPQQWRQGRQGREPVQRIRVYTHSALYRWTCGIITTLILLFLLFVVLAVALA